jgi:transcriptional regulator with XRE-family HTH domain/tetratricopeptide (TPR) repeat protein
VSTGIGRWLRQQREARGWARREMANRLTQAAQAASDATMPGIEHLETYIRRWESGRHQLTERYRLHYCTAFGLRPSQFGTAPLPPPKTLPQQPAPQAPPASSGASPLPGVAPLLDLTSHSPAPADCTESCEPDTDYPAPGRRVVLAAHDASGHVEQAEQHRIGEVTGEQLHCDVARLARASDISDPAIVFEDLDRVRMKVCRLLERRLWPAEQADLYVALGCLNGLIGTIAVRLGYPDAAEELLRSGWAYAGATGHRPLQAQLRRQQSGLMYWLGRYTEARDLAADGLRYVSAGWPGASLHLHVARAAARLGDADAARQAIGDAHRARDRDYTDDLVAMGGQFALSWATHHGLAGAALTEAPGGRDEAAEELERAIGLYEAGPGKREDHWLGGQPLASIDLALTRLRSGALDAAADALQPPLSLPIALRIAHVTTRLAAVREELSAPIYRRSAQARDLDEQIDEFGRETILAKMHTPRDGAA